MLKIISLIMLIIGCGRAGKPSPAPSTPELEQQVKLKAELYEELIFNSRVDQDGFILWKECDGTLYSGILGSALPGRVNLLAARASDGSWRRRSLTVFPDCYYITKEEKEQFGVGGSASTTSRDMVIGQLWWIWKNKELQVAIDMMEFAKANDYIMGQGDPARVALMPNLTKLLADIIYKLSDGKVDYWQERVVTAALVTYPLGLDDYEAHIQMWQILLDAEVNNGIKDKQIEVINAQFNRRPDNPLYAAAHSKWVSGDKRLALELLLHPRWPADRLPTWEDYCGSWWLATDNPKNMVGCPAEEGKATHAEPTGAEVVTVYNLILKD